MLDEARRRWPDLDLPAHDFVEFVADRVPDEGELGPALERLRGVDLYLVCAVLRGDARALRILDADYLEPAARRLSHSRLPRECIADARARLVELLVVAEGQRPARLASFGGRGELIGWLYVALAREARRLAAHDARYVPPSGPDLVDESVGSDPELAHFKATYRQAFRASFHAALAELDERERNLLRQHLLDGLNIDQIAALHQIHRATAARWLARVRESLAQRTRAKLMAELGIGEPESESILHMIRSQLDLSITRELNTGS